jgi:hypothetical protein
LSDIEKKDMLTVAVGEAVEKDTECLLCWMIERSEMRYLETFFSECVMDSGYRDKVIRSRGFCRHHFHRLLSFALTNYSNEKLGLALVLENLVEARSRDMERSHTYIKDLPRTRAKDIVHFLIDGVSQAKRKRLDECLRRIRSLIEAKERLCPACESLKNSDENHVDTLARMLIAHSSFQETFENSKGLCLIHLLKVIEALRLKYEAEFPGLSKTLLELQLRNFHRIRSELKELIRKHDYRFQNEMWKSEKDVVERAVPKLIGTRQLGPGREEDGVNKILKSDLR